MAVDLKGKVALVTGATSGIGFETADFLAGELGGAARRRARPAPSANRPPTAPAAAAAGARLAERGHPHLAAGGAGGLLCDGRQLARR
jgi:NAD(P)-dependent dehydrogenase (short-subunit alcohol dehydrogenase family)